MSNVFKDTGVVYFQVPDCLVQSELLKELRPASVKFYLILLSQAQRHTRTSLKLTNEEFEKLAGLSPNSVRAARTELKERGVITFKIGAGNTYTYTLLDPGTGEPLPKPGQGRNATNGTKAASVPDRTACQPRESEPEKEPGDNRPDFFAALTTADKEHYFKARLQGHAFSRAGDGFLTNCPFHDDQKASLKVDFEKGVWHCHGACNGGGGLLEFEQKIGSCTKQAALRRIAEVIDRPDLIRILRPTTKIEAIYQYVDEDGKLLSQVVRRTGKSFTQRRPGPKGMWINNVNGVRRVLYRLPEVMAAEVVLIVEGEKDADRARQALSQYGKFATTTNPGGAGKWRDEFSEALHGKRVAIIPDNDEPGHRHAATIARSVYAHGATQVKVVHLPGLAEHGDLSDFLARHPVDELIALVKGAGAWRPEQAA